MSPAFWNSKYHNRVTGRARKGKCGEWKPLQKGFTFSSPGAINKRLAVHIGFGKTMMCTSSTNDKLQKNGVCFLRYTFARVPRTEFEKTVGTPKASTDKSYKSAVLLWMQRVTVKFQFYLSCNIHAFELKQMPWPVICRAPAIAKQSPRTSQKAGIIV